MSDLPVKFPHDQAYRIVHTITDQQNHVVIHKNLFRYYDPASIFVLCDLLSKEPPITDTDSEGWFHTSSKIRVIDTPLSERTYRRRLELLVGDGVISTKRVGVPPRMFYRINHQILAGILVDGKQDKTQSGQVGRFKAATLAGLDNSAPKSGAPRACVNNDRSFKIKNKTAHVGACTGARARTRPREGMLPDSPKETPKQTIPKFQKWMPDETWISHFTKPEFSTPEFTQIWLEWIAYRKYISKPLHRLPTAAPKQIAELMEVSPDVAIEAIKHSMTNGWTGLFPKGDVVSRRAAPQIPAVTDAPFDWQGLDESLPRFEKHKARAETRAMEMWETLSAKWAADKSAMTPQLESQISTFAHQCMVFARCEAAGEYRQFYGSGKRTIDIYEKFILEDDYYQTFTFTNFGALRMGGKIWEAFLRWKSKTLGQDVITGKRV